MVIMTHLGDGRSIQYEDQLGDLADLETKTSLAVTLVISGTILVAGALIWFLVATSPKEAARD